ncbi:MAG TPA: glycosyltransferase [Acidimicrobiales bacterium]|nr:glycosyltransferase [Acidimicrobiales bacterium]
MSRFLLATWDGGGTIPPELGLAAELVDRGHEVAVLSDDTVEHDAAAAGAAFAPWQRAPQARARDEERALIRDWEVKSPLAQIRQIGDLLLFGPASLHAADVADAISEHRPDVLIVDALLTGATAAAERSGLPTAAIAPNVNMLRTPGVPPMGSGLGPRSGPVGRARDAFLHRVTDALMGTGALNDARRDLGLAPVRSLDESVRRADKVILLTSAAFDFLPPHPDPQIVYGGIPIPPGERSLPDWVPPWADDGRPAVLLSLSTTYMHQEDLLQRLVDALGQVGCHALVTTGPGLRAHPLTRVPGNVHVVETAPHGAVLPHVDLAITHGGHGTLIRSLAQGVPVVVVPISRDQPDNAARVVHRHVGVSVSKRSSPDAFAAAIGRALDDRSLRTRAESLAGELAPDLGAPKAVAALEELAGLA